MTRELAALVERVAQALEAGGRMLATAESCTGGEIAAALTSRTGSSVWFDRGWVTYSNASKQDQLGVTAESLEAAGAVSEAVVREMVQGARERSAADAAIAVTGIAGPSGGTPDKPVGTVWIGWAAGKTVEAACFRFPGERAEVRRRTVAQALEGLLQRL